jgi:hypothetical protein
VYHTPYTAKHPRRRPWVPFSDGAETRVWGLLTWFWIFYLRVGPLPHALWVTTTRTPSRTPSSVCFLALTHLASLPHHNWVRTTVRTRPLKLRADFPPAPPPRLISGLLALTRSAHRRPIYQSVGGVFFGGVVRPPRVDTRAHVPNHLHSASPPPPPHPPPPPAARPRPARHPHTVHSVVPFIRASCVACVLVVRVVRPSKFSRVSDPCFAAHPTYLADVGRGREWVSFAWLSVLMVTEEDGVGWGVPLFCTSHAPTSSSKTPLRE